MTPAERAKLLAASAERNKLGAHCTVSHETVVALCLALDAAERKPVTQTDEEIEKLRQPALVFAAECASEFGLYATAEVISRLLAATDQLTAERDEERRKRCTMTERVMALAKELELTQDNKFALTKALAEERNGAERMRKQVQQECEEQASREHEAAVTARASHLLMSGDAKQKEYARDVLRALAIRIAELPTEVKRESP